MTDGTVLDVSAITDIATQRTIYAGVVLRQAVERGQDVIVPAVAWMEAWADAAAAAMPFLELLRSSSAVSFAGLDEPAAQASGLLLNRSGAARGVSRGTAHAVHLARVTGWPVLTADRGPSSGLTRWWGSGRCRNPVRNSRPGGRAASPSQIGRAVRRGHVGMGVHEAAVAQLLGGAASGGGLSGALLGVP